MRRPTAAARLAVLIASLVLLAGCTAATLSPSVSPPLVSPSGSPQPSIVGSPPPTPVRTLAAEPRWERVPDQQVFANAPMSAVAAGPDRFVAVGLEMSWISVDGVTWRMASTPLSDGWPTGVIHDQIGYVAWGLWRNQAVVWTSPDGDAWSRAPGIPSFQDVEIAGVARLGDDLFAVATDLQAWTSQDGLAWQSVSRVAPMVEEPGVQGVTSAGSALVAWGYARSGDRFRPVTMRSADGRRWDVGRIEPGLDGYMSEGIGEIVAADGRIVAVGNGLGGEAGSPPPPTAAWTSGDGLAWTPAELRPERSSGGLYHIVWSEGEYTALGLNDLDSIVWRSIDGTSWVQSASVPDAGRDGEEEGCTGGPCPRTVVNDLAGGRAGLVAVGQTSTTSGGSNAVVWIAPANGSPSSLASPTPSANNRSTLTPAPVPVPPKPTGVTFDDDHDVSPDESTEEITQTVTWQAPRDQGVEIRVYGVTQCIAEPADPSPGSHGPCLVEHTPLPASVRTLLATAPASAGAVSWTWTEDAGCDVGLAYDPAGPAYRAVVLAAYSSSGHSIFAIAEPGGWSQPTDLDMIC